MRHARTSSILLAVALLGWPSVTPAHGGGAARAAPPGGLQDTLVAIERESWAGWKNRDGTVYDHYLSDDHIDLGGGGRSTKAEVVAFVGSPACVVDQYTLDDFRVTQVSPDVALLTYRADQITTCRHPLPHPAWVSSLYVRRGGRWLNVRFQETNATGA